MKEGRKGTGKKKERQIIMMIDIKIKVLAKTISTTVGTIIVMMVVAAMMMMIIMI